MHYMGNWGFTTTTSKQDNSWILKEKFLETGSQFMTIKWKWVIW